VPCSAFAADPDSARPLRTRRPLVKRSIRRPLAPVPFCLRAFASKLASPVAYLHSSIPCKRCSESRAKIVRFADAPCKTGSHVVVTWRSVRLTFMFMNGTFINGGCAAVRIIIFGDPEPAPARRNAGVGIARPCFRPVPPLFRSQDLASQSCAGKQAESAPCCAAVGCWLGRKSRHGLSAWTFRLVRADHD
jgi:hypothetical protein